MPRDLPSGTVTFLFTDVEGSTQLLHALGPEAYAAALAEHRRVLRDAFRAEGGVEVDTQGDAFFVAFPTADGAVRAAAVIRDDLAPGPIRVRMGLHTGRPYLGDEGYIGADVHKGARIGAAGHGGQVLLSIETRELVSAEVTDLGEHRLKDFAEPVPIYQLGSDRFPPLKTISNTNLPRPASSFVGREREVAEVGALLHEDTRLVSLIGPGGTGKTRLAIESAAELVPHFKAGVFWVALAPLRDPALVAEAIGKTLGAKDGLAEHIGERQMLLLLDNMEHVIGAAPELAALSEACPNLALLVTSRERLNVRGEVPYYVAPLADGDAVALFSARSGLEADDAVARLCRALDNLPLAIELAAARTSVLSPAQILDRLSRRLDLLKGGRDADPRQATLRATIEWSYELLSDEERRLFARLAVFRGGSTLEAAEELVEADLDVLQSLVDKSLLRHGGDRFWMLETIREFAVERLEASGEADGLRRRHAEHFMALAEEAEPHVFEESSRGGATWLDRLERELDNIRAALDVLASQGDADRQLRLAGSLSEFWCAREHVAEGRSRLEEALAAGSRPTPARAMALSGAAHMARDNGDPTAALHRATEALKLHQEHGDVWRAGDVLLSLGQAAGDIDDFSRARDAFAESSRSFTEAGDEDNALFADRLLSWAYHELGERARARQLTERTLERARALGNRSLQATLLGALASRALEDGRPHEAAVAAPEALRLVAELGDRKGVADQLAHSAGVLARIGSPERAAALLASSLAMYEETGRSLVPTFAAENERTLAAIKEHLEPGVLGKEWESGRKLSSEAAVSLALNAFAAVAESRADAAAPR
jgi:predicted ATPase